MNPRRRVWFHRSRAAIWLILGAVSFPLGWADSVVVVWLASVYANAVSDWTASEAADDQAITDRLDRIEQKLDTILDGRPPCPTDLPPSAM